MSFNVGHILIVLAYSLGEYWLGKTKRVAANSTWELLGFLIGRIFRKRHEMEKDIELGAGVGEVKFSFEAGKGRVEINAAIPGQVGVSGGAFVEADATVLITKLFDAIEKASPVGAQALEEGVKQIILAAVKQLT